jgi:branched-chain amino acid transport system ATP-binding protein
MDYVLAIDDVSKDFGGISAVKNLSIQVEKNKILSIIGPNGAGKTTVFNLLTGFYKPDKGKFIYGGADITGFPPHKVAEIGIARTFQNIKIFPWMTALDNVLVARQLRERTGFLRSMLRTNNLIKKEKLSTEKAMDVLKHFHIADKFDFQAKNLSYGDQRKLEMARALATEPKILLLDEPTAGMNSSESEECVKVIYDIKNKLGITIILIEHDMNIVMSVSDRVVVLDHGEKIAVGNPGDVQKDKAVIKAYLGEEFIAYAENQ